MKSTVKENRKAQEITYPCLMMLQGSGVVVLFSADDKGTVIGSDRDDFKIGNYDDYNAKAFTPFNGEVILTN